MYAVEVGKHGARYLGQGQSEAAYLLTNSATEGGKRQS